VARTEALTEARRAAQSLSANRRRLVIERYVFIKLTDEHATPAGRREVATRSRALSALPGASR